MRPTPNPQVQHILNEATIMCNIEHPFIIKLCQTFQDEHQLYMVMEYASGGEIWKHIKDLGKFSSEVARFYSAEVVLALEYLHAQDIIYYDLKPENLMLDAAGHIKLIDFGFARATDDPSTATRGTPEYLAPEVVEGSHHSVMVDWWALGCLIYEMMVGVPPFLDEFRRLGVYDKILRGHVHYPWWLNRHARDLIQQLLRADPTERLGAKGAADVQRHLWYRDVSWRWLLKRKVPPPCLTPQQGAPPVEETAGEAPAEPKGRLLDSEQQDLFRDFGPYDEGPGAAPRAGGFRPKWLVRRERQVQDWARRRSLSAVASGYAAGDLLLTGSPPGGRGRVVSPGAPRALSAEQQQLFASFGAAPRRDSLSPAPARAAGPPAAGEGRAPDEEPSLEIDRRSANGVRARASTVDGTARARAVFRSDDGLDTWVIVHEDRPAPPPAARAPEPDQWVLVNARPAGANQSFVSLSSVNESFTSSDLWSDEDNGSLLSLLQSSKRAGDVVVLM